jgi:photosystem II stability/assembly factor-like uncharacterized protein
MRKETPLVLTFLLLSSILLACSPSQSDLDAHATKIAEEIFATQTAQAPSLAPTPSSTSTPIPTSTATATPVPPTPPPVLPTPTPVPPTPTPTPSGPGLVVNGWRVVPVATVVGDIFDGKQEFVVYLAFENLGGGAPDPAKAWCPKECSGDQFRLVTSEGYVYEVYRGASMWAGNNSIPPGFVVQGHRIPLGSLYLYGLGASPAVGTSGYQIQTPFGLLDPTPVEVKFPTSRPDTDFLNVGDSFAIGDVEVTAISITRPDPSSLLVRWRLENPNQGYGRTVSFFPVSLGDKGVFDPGPVANWVYASVGPGQARDVDYILRVSADESNIKVILSNFKYEAEGQSVASSLGPESFVVFNVPDGDTGVSAVATPASVIPLVPLGLDGETVSLIATGKDGIIYAGTNKNEHGVFKSSDNGGNWSAKNNGLGGLNIRHLVIAPDNPDIVIATGTYNRVWISTDGGASWAPTQQTGPVTLGSRDGSILFSVEQYIYVHESTDAGKSWHKIADFGDCQYLYTVASSGVMYCLTSDKPGGFKAAIYRSNDRGRSWWKAASAGASYDLTTLGIDHTNDSTIYAGTKGYGIYKTTDGGGSWTPINNTLPNQGDGLHISSILVDPLDPNVVYVAILNEGLFESTDGGETWRELTAGLDPEVSGNILSLGLSQDSHFLFVGTDGYGIFRYQLSGQAAALVTTPSSPTSTPAADSATPTATIPDCYPGGLFANLWQRYATRLGCPQTGWETDRSFPPYTFGEMPFEGGHMFSSMVGQPQMYVTYGTGGPGWTGQGTWEVYPITWQEGDPEFPCPQERDDPQQPKWGFGQVWCDHPQVRLGLGWGTDRAKDQDRESPGANVYRLQLFENGFIFRDSDGWTYNVAYAFFNDDTFVRESYK